MKIKKITPAEVADGTLTLKDYLKNFGSTVPSGMASDTAPTEYFARLNYAYPDAPKRKVPLLIVGEMTATWSKLCKSELKDNKKFVSYGTCQLAKDDAGADIIELQPTKGSGKLRMLEALFNKVAAKTGIAIRVKPGTGEAAEGNTLTADDEKELAAASVASDDDLTNEAPAPNSRTKQTPQEEGKDLLQAFEDLKKGGYTGKQPLGCLSKQFESGLDKSIDTISTGSSDIGGVSYGIYQMASAVKRTPSHNSTVGQFVKQHYPKDFGNLMPGSPEFSAVWKKVAKREPERFAGLQHQFIAATHFDPKAKILLTQTGVDIYQRSRPLQDVVWSVCVQHAGAMQILTQAFASVGNSKATDKQLIEAVYKVRTAYVASVRDSGDKSANEKQVFNNIIEKRYPQELKLALSGLANVGEPNSTPNAPKQHPLEAAYPNLETMRKQVDAIIDKLDVNAATIPISAANLATIQSYMKNMSNWLAMWQSGDEAAKKAFETTYKGWAKARFDGYVWLKNNLLPKCKASANNPDEQHIKSLANEIIQLYKQLTQA